MKTIAIINLKGGVGKTITAINMASILAKMDSRVLIIDNDKQGNTSKFFGVYDYEKKSIADILTEKNFDIESAIYPTNYKNLEIIPANMKLLEANLKVIMDMSRQQQTILKKALKQIEDRYDYCIIDNAPDINISVINALVIANDVIVPIKIDQFAFDGLAQLTEQFAGLQELNPELKFKGCLVTQYANNLANSGGVEYLRSQEQYPVFKTVIRRTVKVDESTFVGQPLINYAPKSMAAKDYLNFVKEYLEQAE